MHTPSVGRSPGCRPLMDAGNVIYDACLEANPLVNRMTDTYKTLPCPKLRLRAVTKWNWGPLMPLV